MEAGTADEALEKALSRCVEHVSYHKNTPSGDSTIHMVEVDGVIYPDNPDSVEYFLEDEFCEVVQ